MFKKINKRFAHSFLPKVWWVTFRLGTEKSLTFFTMYVLWLSAPGCPGSFLAFLLENLRTKAESMVKNTKDELRCDKLHLAISMAT